MFNVKTLNNTSAAKRYLPDCFSLADDHASYDAILVRSADLLTAEFPSELAAIARAGAGTNNIPIDRCTEQGIVVFNTPGANANAVKELVLCGMLLAGRDIVGGANWVTAQKAEGMEGIEKAAEKAKSKFAGREILGKKLGVIGLGAIGALVANACVSGLGMTALGFDPYLTPAAAERIDKRIEITEDINRIYRECDYITVHVPLLDTTKGMISHKQLEMMHDGAVILNFARGGLVDNAAVKTAASEGKVKYVSDFAADELVGTNNIILLPHLGASTPEAEENCAQMASEELRDYLLEGKIRNSVNMPAFGADMTAKFRVAITGVGCEKCCEGMRSLFPNAVKFDFAVRKEAIYVVADMNEQPSETTLAALKEKGAFRKVRIIKAV